MFVYAENHDQKLDFNLSNTVASLQECLIDDPFYAEFAYSLPLILCHFLLWALVSFHMPNE